MSDITYSTIYISTGAKLSSYYSKNKRIEFNLLENELKRVVKNFKVVYASIMRHNDQCKLKLRTHDKTSKAKLDDSKTLNQFFSGITLVEKHTTKSTKSSCTLQKYQRRKTKLMNMRRNTGTINIQ